MEPLGAADHPCPEVAMPRAQGVGELEHSEATLEIQNQKGGAINTTDLGLPFGLPLFHLLSAAVLLT